MSPSPSDNKVIRDGKVAVAYSPGYGAGWCTWNESCGLSPFEPKVIAMIKKGKQDEIDSEWCERELGLKGVYCGGASDLRIKWLPVGTTFRIHEYDGSESVMTEEDFQFTA